MSRPLLESYRHWKIRHPILAKFFGVFCIFLGVIGLIAPVIPGFPILFIGVELLGWDLSVGNYLRRWRKK